MKPYLKILFLPVVVFLGVLPTQAISVFPTVLLDNTTGFAASNFIGAPDDVHIGIGGRVVTYDFGLTPILNLPGQDFNVYKVDFGTVEFSRMRVYVSNDGVIFHDIKATEGPGLSLSGAEVHSNTNFVKSYNLGASPLSQARYLRIDGNGTGGAGLNNDFDLDAVGALYPDISVPDGGTSAWMMILGLAGLGLYRKFSEAV